MVRSMTVKEVMDTWTLKKGFPVINVDRNYEENKATFSQVIFDPKLLCQSVFQLPTKHNF